MPIATLPLTPTVTLRDSVIAASSQCFVRAAKDLISLRDADAAAGGLDADRDATSDADRHAASDALRDATSDAHRSTSDADRDTNSPTGRDPASDADRTTLPRLARTLVKQLTRLL